MASSPISLVRMRTARSIAVTQICPSPILLVRAASAMVAVILSAPFGGAEHFDLDLGHEKILLVGVSIPPETMEEVDLVLGTPVGLGVPTLAAEALDLGDGHALHAGALQGFLNGVELVGLDDGGYEMQHVDPPQLGTGSGERLLDHRECRGSLTDARASLISAPSPDVMGVHLVRDIHGSSVWVQVSREVWSALQLVHDCRSGDGRPCFSRSPSAASPATARRLRRPPQGR
jgi:hypothetical protein